jgi:hypothetical protein
MVAILASVDFEIAHPFDATAEAVAEVLLDRDFQDSLGDLDGLAERRILTQEERDGRTTRRTRYVLDVTVNGPAKKFLGDASPAWVEVAHWDPDRLAWSWVIEPEIAAELLDARGTTGITENEEGTVRAVIGSVKVRVPIYGSRVERWVVEGLERAYAEEALRIERWLKT